MRGHRGSFREPQQTQFEKLADFVQTPHLHMKKLRPREVAVLSKVAQVGQLFSPGPVSLHSQGQFAAPAAEGGI